MNRREKKPSSYKRRKKQDKNEDDETRKTEIKESLYHSERLGFENGNVEGVVERKQVERRGGEIE